MSLNKLPSPPMKYRQELFGVSDVNLAYLQNVYNISERSLRESVELIQDWCNKQPHFPRYELEKQWVIRILSVNKFSVEKSKTKIENLFTARSIMKEFFSVHDTHDPKLNEFLNMSEWVIFPKTTPDKYRVVLIRLKNPDMQNFDPYMMYTLSIMIGDIRCAMDAVRGDIYIWDFTNSSLGLITKVPPTLIKKSVHVIQNCYGQSIKGIHMLNVPPVAEFIFNLVKGVQPKNIAERMHLHKNVESIYEFIPRSLFPSDMGGDETKTSEQIADLFKEAFRSPEWRQWYMDTMKLRTDESKRLIKNTNIIDECYGLDGTFKKLDID